MCGVAGWVGHGDPELLRRMLETLHHRGPDEIGVWANDSAALGISRLAIIDVVNGHQPVFSPDGQIVAVLNGEIYNFRELSREIRSAGRTLRSGSDAEVLPHLYESYGTDFVHHLRGMFAIALWDGRLQRLLLARDRVGKKPMVYRRDPSGLMFASEARALLATGWRPNANLTALNHVLAFGYLPERQGAFQGLESLPPGHIATWDGGNLAVRRYWSWEPQAPLHPAQAKPAVREALNDAVRVRMVSERPIGAFLSGGVDSSIIAALMAQNHPEQIKTFTIGFEHGEFDETSYADEVAQYLGTDHTTLTIQPDPGLLISQLVEAFDQPLADPSVIPTMLLCGLARQSVVVALSGDGGDEAFGGYERYLAAPTMQHLNPLLTLLAPFARAAARTADKQHRRKVSRILWEMQGRESLMDRYRAIMSIFTTQAQSRIWSRAALEQVDQLAPELLFQRVWGESKEFPSLWRMRYQDLRTYLPGDLLVKADITSMSRSLEVRSPFLDQRVLQLAASLPSGQLVHGRRTKSILRDLADELLPTTNMNRRKIGFGVPVAKWLRGPLREVASDVLLGPSSRERGWFNIDEVETMLKRHMSGEDLHKQLWAVFVLELWAQEWL